MFQSSDSTWSSPTLSASSAAYSPPTKPFSPAKPSYSYMPSASASHHSLQHQVQDQLWLPSNQMMYTEYTEQRFQQPQWEPEWEQHNSSPTFQHSPTKRQQPPSNLDPDSIMKVHDDLPSAALLAWERLKAKNQRLNR